MNQHFDYLIYLGEYDVKMHKNCMDINLLKRMSHYCQNRTPHPPYKLFLHRMLHEGSDLPYVLLNDKQNILSTGKL